MSAILRNFAREYEGVDGSRASFAADAFEHIPRITQCMFFRNSAESFPHSARVDCFARARNRTRDADMLTENLEFSINSVFSHLPQFS